MISIEILVDTLIHNLVLIKFPLTIALFGLLLLSLIGHICIANYYMNLPIVGLNKKKWEKIYTIYKITEHMYGIFFCLIILLSSIVTYFSEWNNDTVIIYFLLSSVVLIATLILMEITIGVPSPKQEENQKNDQ